MKIPWRRDRLLTQVFLGFPCGSAGKETIYNARDLGSIPGLGRYLGKVKGYPLQYFSLENSVDYIVHGGHKESDITEPFHFHLYYIWQCKFPCYSFHTSHPLIPFPMSISLRTFNFIFPNRITVLSTCTLALISSVQSFSHV